MDQNKKKDEAEPKPERAEAPYANPLTILLPADPQIVRETKELLLSRNVGINRLAELIAEDAVLALEVIGAANRQSHADRRPPIENVRTALFRLGSEQLLGVLDAVSARPEFEHFTVDKEFAKLRLYAWRVSNIGRIIAGIVHRGLQEDAQMAGLMAPLGFMLACARYQQRYADLAGRLNKAQLNYRLAQERHFDVNAVQISYLEARQFPQSLYYVYDRDFQCKTPLEAALRFLVFSAMELVDAFDLSKWEKFSPQSGLPVKCSLRLLRITEKQHARIYEECGDFLGQVQKAETPAEAVKTLPEPKEEIQIVPEFGQLPAIPETNELAPIEYVEVGPQESAELPEHFSEGSRSLFSVLTRLFKDSKTSEDLLKKLMSILTTAGPFMRVALLIVRNNRRSALVHIALGQGLEDGTQISVHDPLSPIAMCTTKVKSFNAQEAVDLAAPFGITAYALSPVKIEDYSPVLLYADCGPDRPLPFEARRIFRLVVGLLNSTLPRLPGGLPKHEDFLGSLSL